MPSELLEIASSDFPEFLHYCPGCGCNERARQFSGLLIKDRPRSPRTVWSRRGLQLQYTALTNIMAISLVTRSMHCLIADGGPRDRNRQSKFCYAKLNNPSVLDLARQMLYLIMTLSRNEL